MIKANFAFGAAWADVWLLRGMRTLFVNCTGTFALASPTGLASRQHALRRQGPAKHLSRLAPVRRRGAAGENNRQVLTAVVGTALGTGPGVATGATIGLLARRSAWWSRRRSAAASAPPLER